MNTLVVILPFPFHLLIPAKPEGDLNHLLTPAALCNLCMVLIYSIFTLMTLLVFHMAVPKTGRIFSSCAAVIFCSVASASLLIYSVCLFSAQEDITDFIFFCLIYAPFLSLFPFHLPLDVRQCVILPLRYSQGPMSFLQHIYSHGQFANHSGA